jgi:hypothetical protein
MDRGASSIPVKVSGIAKTEEVSTTKTLAYSTELPMTPNMAGVIVDGVIADGWEKLDLEFNRELEPVNALTGSDYISQLPSKTFTAKLSGSGVYGTNKLDDTIRNAYRNRTTLAIVVSIIISVNRSVVFTFPRVQLDSFSGPKLSGSDLIRADFSGIILLPTSGNNQVVIKNNRSTSYTA